MKGNAVIMMALRGVIAPFSVIMALGGLMVLFSACEGDMAGKAGGKVAIIFSVSGGSEAQRSFSLREPERVALEIENEEDYFLSATIAPDEEGLRAVTTSALIEGQKVHLEAYYTSSGALAGSADYHANSAGLLVLDDPDSPLEVDPALGPYDFSAYSYYKSTSSLSLTGIDPRTDDLIWGNITNQTITASEAGRTVSFNLKHKFSQVRVRISVSKIAGATITDIGTVTIGSQKTVDLTVKDGGLADDADVGALDVTSSLSTTNNITYLSDYSVFYPSPTKVTISYIKIKVGSVETTYNTLSTTFTEGVTAGGNYTLAVDLEKYWFAHSNIYWDGERLTFDKSGAIPDSKHYEGLSFKWGSLVGVPLYPYFSDIPFYIPNVNDGTWDGTTTINYSSSTDWTSIESVNATDNSYMGQDGKSYLYDHPDFSNYKGDICSYLTNGVWRMPRAYDFYLLQQSSTAGSYGPPTVPAASNAEGTGTIGAGWMLADIFFPVTPYRRTTGEYIGTGVEVRYWSGSVSSATHGMGTMADIRYAGFYYSYSHERDYGFPVRCMKN